MEEKKSIKISLSTVLLILAIIAIIVMGYFLFDISNKINIAEQEKQTLNDKISDLQETLSNVSNIIDNSKVDINEKSNSNQTSDLTENQKNALFNKIIHNMSNGEGVLLNWMIDTKDFSVKNFTDEDILTLLPVFDDSDYFDYEVNDQEGFFVKGKITDIQKASQKYFGRTVDINKISNKIENDLIWISASTGFGISTYKLESISTIEDNTYAIKFKYNEEDTSYILTVNYENDNIIFISFEK